jgi:transposase-like protein
MDAVKEIVTGGKSVAEVSRERKISSSLVSKWKKQYLKDPENAFRGNKMLHKKQYS